MSFLYGNHIVKAHLGRITEDTPEHQGVVVYNMKDIPLVRCLLFSPAFFVHHVAGLRCDCTIDHRHKKTRSNGHHRLPSSVCISHLFYGRNIDYKTRDVGEYLRDEAS